MRFIDVDYLLNSKEYGDISNARLCDDDHGEWINTIKEIADAMPTADVQPVRRGKWIDESVTTGTTIGGATLIRQYRCSVCGGLFGNLSDRYCYNCGARMDLEGEA